MTKVFVLLRVLSILVVAIGPAAYCYLTLEGIRSTYASNRTECTTVSAAAPDTKEVPVVVGTIQKQSEVLQNWGLALLGGVVVLLATPNLHQFRFTYLIHLSLAPTLGLLGGSIYASLLLLRRMTYLQGTGCLTPTPSINSLLAEQTVFLLWAVLLLAFFALWCLIERSAGWARVDQPSP